MLPSATNAPLPPAGFFFARHSRIFYEVNVSYRFRLGWIVIIRYNRHVNPDVSGKIVLTLKKKTDNKKHQTMGQEMNNKSSF